MLLEPLQCQEYKIMVQLTTPTGLPVGVVSKATSVMVGIDD